MPGELPRQQLLPRLQLDRGGVARVAGEDAPAVAQRRFAGGIVKEKRQLLHRIIAAGAVNAPAVRLRLARREDLFDHDPGIGPEPLTQSMRIADRIAQPVDMVDADPVDQPFVVKAQDQRVRPLEDRRILDPHPGKLIDRKEAPPVECVVRGAPPCQTVMLPGQHLGQGIAVGRVLIGVA